MLTPRNITAIGELSCRGSICPGECSEKTSQLRDYLRKRFTSGTDFESAMLKLLSLNRECPATNWASSLAALILSSDFWPAAALVFILPWPAVEWWVPEMPRN